jgi:hypothetical protein
MAAAAGYALSRPVEHRLVHAAARKLPRR